MHRVRAAALLPAGLRMGALSRLQRGAQFAAVHQPGRLRRAGRMLRLRPNHGVPGGRAARRVLALSRVHGLSAAAKYLLRRMRLVLGVLGRHGHARALRSVRRAYRRRWASALSAGDVVCTAAAATAATTIVTAGGGSSGDAADGRGSGDAVAADAAATTLYVLSAAAVVASVGAGIIIGASADIERDSAVSPTPA